MDINKYNMFCHCERSEAIAKSLGLLRFALYETLRERNDILDLIMTIYLQHEIATVRASAFPVRASAFPARASAMTFPCFAHPARASAFPARASAFTFPYYAQPVRASAFTFPCFAQPARASVMFVAISVLS
jgi:hypothetical protein